MSTWTSPAQVPNVPSLPPGGQPDLAYVKTLQEYIKKLANVLSAIRNDLEFLINGNLDVKNIRANSITADRLSVDELSAISANLGHITAGLIEAVQIYGSYIATSQGYPRTEFSSTGNFLKAAASPTVDVTISPDGLGNATPMLIFDHNGLFASMYISPTQGYVFSSVPNVTIGSNNLLTLTGAQVRIKSGALLDSINQPNSSATDVAGIVSDFNTLLSNLRAMNILA